METKWAMQKRENVRIGFRTREIRMWERSGSEHHLPEWGMIKYAFWRLPSINAAKRLGILEATPEEKDKK